MCGHLLGGVLVPAVLSLSCLPGLDYVSHEDILPYTSTDQVPIQHELFERFLLYDQTKGNFSDREVEMGPAAGGAWHGEVPRALFS